jgi:hypothetical protein
LRSLEESSEYPVQIADALVEAAAEVDRHLRAHEG